MSWRAISDLPHLPACYIIYNWAETALDNMKARPAIDSSTHVSTLQVHEEGIFAHNLFSMREAS